MPTRRSRRRKYFVKKNKRIVKSSKPKFFLPFLFFLAVFGFYIFTARSFWDGKTKVNLAIQKSDGNVLITTFDPLVGEIINVEIPGNTEVEVARGFGVWKLESLWKLAENENLPGILLAETITRYFKFPVSAWADEPALGLTEAGVIAAFRSVIFPYKTNLKIGDKIQIALFSLGVSNTQRVNINLAETLYIKKTTFIDESEGYVINRAPSDELLSIYTDSEISKLQYKVAIEDASGEVGLAQELGKVIEALGAKVVSVSKLEKENIDCLVSGRDKRSTKVLARLFSCSIQEVDVKDNFDFKMKVGTEFAKRY